LSDDSSTQTESAVEPTEPTEAADDINTEAAQDETLRLAPEDQVVPAASKAETPEVAPDKSETEPAETPEVGPTDPEHGEITFDPGDIESVLDFVEDAGFRAALYALPMAAVRLLVAVEARINNQFAFSQVPFEVSEGGHLFTASWDNRTIILNVSVNYWPNENADSRYTNLEREVARITAQEKSLRDSLADLEEHIKDRDEAQADDLLATRNELITQMESLRSGVPAKAERVIRFEV